TQVQRLDVVRHVTMTAGGSEMSPRATPTEEPDGGNLLVRIWRGAGVGNLPAYSTTAFSTARCSRRPRLARTAGLRQDGSGDGRLRREGLACACREGADAHAGGERLQSCRGG